MKNLKGIIALSIVVTMILVSGCRDSNNTESTGVVGSSGKIQEYYLHDGVRCVVFTGGISCDWERVSTPPNHNQHINN